MHGLCTHIYNLLRTGPLVLASIITHSGSSPRSSGARMLVLPDGSIHGTIGGGRYEAEVTHAAAKMLQSGENARGMFFALNKASDMDMICGGGIMVLLEHLSQDDRNLALFSRASQAEGEDKSFAFISRLDFSLIDGFDSQADSPVNSGSISRYLLLRGEDAPALPVELAPALTELWQSNVPFIRRISGAEWLFESVLPAERIHILGGGHLSLALAQLAEKTGFSTSVLDDRPEFANRVRFPHSKVICCKSLAEKHMDEYFAAAHPGESDAVVIVTRGHAFDRDGLAAALRTEAGYIGMIGSAPKRRQVYASLLTSGFSQADLDRVYSPIGLSIGAETPEEIAVSIMAELIQWRHGKLKKPVSEK